MKVKFKKLSDDAQIPKYQTKGSAGADLYASNAINIAAGETKLVQLGFAVELPEGYEMQIRPRSGLTINTPLRVHLGTVDSDYTGEVRVIAENTTKGTDSIQIKKGDRIAQAVFNKVEKASFELTKELTETDRGDGGFGSTNDKEEVSEENREEETTVSEERGQGNDSEAQGEDSSSGEGKNKAPKRSKNSRKSI